MQMLAPIGACLLLMAGASRSTFARQKSAAKRQPVQTTPATSDSLIESMRQMQQRLDALEQQHNQDQGRINHLEQRLNNLEPAAAGRLVHRQPPDAAPQFTPSPEAAPAITQPALAASAGLLGAVLGQGNLYNPAITVFFDLGASLSSSSNNEFNRFNLRETELDFRSAISPFADGVLIATIGEDIGRTPSSDSVDITTEVGIEEGYVDFHTLPFDTALKVGKFRNAFGRNNPLHTHDLPQVDRPLAVQAFFGPEGLDTIGGSLSWLVPNPWDKYIEITTEVVNANNAGPSPILGGPNASNPAIVGHLKYFDDIGETSSLEIGGSFLHTKTAADKNFTANVAGVDVTYLWRDPEAADSRSFLLQSEAFWAQNDIADGAFAGLSNNSFGAYAFGQYQFARNLYAGVRVDYTEFPNSLFRTPNDADWAVSPYFTWYLSEFLRLRIEYQHRSNEINKLGDTQDNLMAQLTFVIGAHPPHPYWVNR